MAVVQLNIGRFKAQHPGFNSLNDAVYQKLFTIAGMILNNTGYSLVTDPIERETLLYLLMAHIAELDPNIVDVNGNTGNGIVGRVSSASEGSVSVSTDYAAMSASSAWFMQTQNGALYWQMTAKYRQFQYVPPPRRGCGCGGR